MIKNSSLSALIQRSEGKWLLVFLFFFISCAAQKSDSISDKKELNVDLSAESIQAISDFRISFISKGSGIDRNAVKTLDRWIEIHEDTSEVRLYVQKTQWGKEGEKDYCFQLNHLPTHQKTAIIDFLKNQYQNNPRVRWAENVPCRGR